MNFKALFSTPKKAAAMIACLLVIAVMMAVCIVYAVNSNGPAENSAIGAENAQNFAFADAGVDPASAQAIQVKFERHQGEFVYEVEFIAGDTEYEYKINASDGAVVQKESKTVKGPESTAVLPGAVTLEEAQAIVLADAGVEGAQATFTEVEQDMEGVLPVYGFKFYAGNMEYEYEINAQTGAIYSKKVTTYVAQNPGGTATAAPRPTQPTATPTQPPSAAQPTQQVPATAQPTQPPAQGGMYVGSEAAKSAALTDAGVSAGDARFTKVRMDYEDGAAVYEIEFYTSTHEYEYKINAKTGAVYSKEAKALSNGSGSHHGQSQNQNPNQNQAGDSFIGTEQAKAAALRHAGCSAEQVVFTKAKLDYDDGRAIYEIEFTRDGLEYELEIDAVTGGVLKYEVDRD